MVNMTRAELRRAQKESESTTKTYNMTAAQLQALENRMYDEAYKRARENILSKFEFI